MTPSSNGSSYALRTTHDALVDQYGRRVEDLRLSVTDRCNFRCIYCMPAAGLDWLPKAEVLSFEEIERVARIFVGCGVREMKITGGEPTVRRELPALIGMLHALAPGLDMSMTTNGFLLTDLAGPLRTAGLARLNVSLDSLHPEKFHAMTRIDALPQVLAGLDAAAAVGFAPIKINCVVMRGYNEDEVVDFATLARARDYRVRFIEFMPLDADGKWTQAQVVPGREILDRIHARYPIEPVAHGPEPSTRYRFSDGAPGEVGVIASVSEPFCASCNRVRITADGQLRVCLFALDETDLRTPLRAGASDDELLALIRDAVWRKWAGHKIGKADFIQPVRTMSAIGG